MKTPTRRTLLDLLKREGPREASRLASSLGVTPTAVRQHLAALRLERLVEERSVRRGRGRPAKLWRLTPEADRVFPDAHAELTVGVIRAAREALGEEGLTRILRERAKRQTEAYRSAIPRSAPLTQRVRALERLRTGEGYMAETRRDKDGSLLLCENHCPICVAATSCQGLCAAELDVFRKVLGPGVVIERIEHILGGARRCAYRIMKRSGTGNQGGSSRPSPAS